MLAGFWEHVKELKQRLKVIFIVLIAATAFFALFPSNPAEMFTARFWMTGMYAPVVSLILNWIRNFVAPRGLEIISLEIGAPFEIYFLASIVFGLLVSSPVMAYEIYKFVDPALHPHERKFVYRFVLGFTGLFIAGGLFGLFILSPFIVYTVILFSQVVSALPVLSVSDFYSMILTIIGLTGFGFTVPEIFVLLVKFGVVKTNIIAKNRVWFYFILYIITAIITPDGGPLADIALFIPMALLWEVALFVAKRYEKKSPASPFVSGPDKSKKCAYCEQTIDDSDVFCKKCGKSQR
ncbi:MAG: twin-arginine translocase subunit TatC [Candidatus Bathyarchaeia archaeon]